MSRFIDLTGRIYGRLTVIKPAGTGKHRDKLWLCKCECGGEKIVTSSNIMYGKTHSCGCLKRERRGKANRLKRIDLTGKVFGRLTVIKCDETYRNHQLMWSCVCACGTRIVVAGSSLRDENTKSCGCLLHDQSSRRGPEHPNWRGLTYKTKTGYILMYQADHPNAKKDGYILEHIFVMSQIVGRPLFKGETVHHKNGIRDDNSPNNLELWVSSHTPGQRVSDLVAWAKELLLKYEPKALLP